MKKMIALLLAMCMLCAMAMAGADEAPLTTVTIALSVDENIVAALSGAGNEATAALGKSLSGILNNLSIRVVADGGKGQGSLNLANQPVATFAVAPTEAGISVLSDLFPSYAVVISQETISQLTASASGGMGNLDLQAIGESLTPKFAAIGEEVLGKIGEPEAVTYNFEGVDFTQYAPLNMTSKELVLLSMNAVKEILADPAMKEVTDKLSGFNAEQIQEQIEKFSSTPEEEMPQMTAGMYLNEAGSLCFVVDLAKDEQAVSVIVAVLEDGRQLVRVSAPEQVAFDMSLNANTGDITMDISGKANGAPMNVSFAGTTKDDSYIGALSISMAGTPVAALSFQVAQGGELTADYSAEGKTAVDFNELAGGAPGEAVQGLISEISTTGLTNLLTAASQAMPEEVGALIGMLMAPANAQ